MIADMICGDKFRDVFPYRSSSYLTEFFRIIGLDYVHRSETRKWWVQKVLDGLNEKGEVKDPDLPSLEIIRVIEQLVGPSEFLNSSTKRMQAIKMLNKSLNAEGLNVIIDSDTGNAQLETRIGKFISTDSVKEKVGKTVTFSPGVFNLPEIEVNLKLVSVMMPFERSFDDIYKSIQQACSGADLEYVRADDIWEESVIIQDIFNIIFESSIVVVDLSGKNPNVLYEVGIAHTLGKIVIPISQSIDDVPFDLRHHRVFTYLNNAEGRDALQSQLEKRLIALKRRLSLE